MVLFYYICSEISMSSETKDISRHYSEFWEISRTLLTFHRDPKAMEKKNHSDLQLSEHKTQNYFKKEISF